MIEVIQAYERSEQIETRTVTPAGIWTDVSNPSWDWYNFEYRVKPQPTYRSYKNVEEFLQAQKEHGMWLTTKLAISYFMPVKILSKTVTICAINTKGIFVPKEISFDELLLDNFIWQDETSCGVKEE